MLVEAPKYIGCFEDGVGGKRDLEIELTKNTSPSNCFKKVKEGGYLYGGLQFGTECFASNSKPDNDKKDDAECNMPCRDDKTIMCGGSGRNSVYQFNYAKDENKEVCSGTKCSGYRGV